MVEAPEIFFVVGEPSGDLHTAQLASELLRRGRFRLTGAGGPRMREAGVATDFDSRHWGAIGIPDALRKVPGLYRRKLQILALLRQRRPRLVVYVDFGAFNVRLARAVRQLPFRQPTFYFFPPASWDRSERDRSPLAALADTVATPFPWSEGLLRQDGVNAHFVGHPVLDRLGPSPDQEGLRRALGLPAAQHLIGLLPGSRRVERGLLGPPMLEAARRLAARGGYHFLWSPSPTASGAPERLPADLASAITVVPDSGLIFQAADLVLTAFGTATLEGAAALCPMLGMYRGTWAMRLQYRLMRIPTEFYAMPNIILERRLIPELLQDEASGPELARQVAELMANPKRLAELRVGLQEVRRRLGEPGATMRTADLILTALEAPTGGLA